MLASRDGRECRTVSLPSPIFEVDVGDPVELRVRFTGGWSGGFLIAAVVDGGYRVFRLSDGTLLPGVTGAADVRPARYPEIGKWARF
jgi:hypothetical protein